MNKIEPVCCEFQGLVHEIKSSLVVAPSKMIAGHGATPVVCTAIWDTGAACSVVSSEVVRQLNLSALGKKPVHTANGMYLANVYSVDVMLPNKLVVSGVAVTDSDLTRLSTFAIEANVESRVKITPCGRIQVVVAMRRVGKTFSRELVSYE